VYWSEHTALPQRIDLQLLQNSRKLQDCLALYRMCGSDEKVVCCILERFEPCLRNAGEPNQRIRIESLVQASHDAFTTVLDQSVINPGAVFEHH